MQIHEVISYLESIAPPQYQEEYDNSGLQCGDTSQEIKSVLLCLDITEAVIKDAIEKNCNLVISHHPLLFKSIKSITSENETGRALTLAIKNDIAIYSIHTNLDKILTGVNARICEKLGLINTRILSPSKGNLSKLFTFVPVEHAEKVRAALFQAGAGHIGNYDQCSFNSEGTGTFRALEGSDPFVGEKGKQHQEKEIKVEMIFPSFQTMRIIQALKTAHPYEEVAYDIIKLENSTDRTGAGMIGELPAEMEEMEVLSLIKDRLRAKVIRYSPLLNKPVKTLALCGGSGSFLLPDAIKAGAALFLTSDVKYHQFFEPESRILLVDIGHFESEQFTPELIKDILTKKFSNFAVLFTSVNTNPVNYY